MWVEVRAVQDVANTAAGVTDYVTKHNRDRGATVGPTGEVTVGGVKRWAGLTVGKDMHGPAATAWVFFEGAEAKTGVMLLVSTNADPPTVDTLVPKFAAIFDTFQVDFSERP